MKSIVKIFFTLLILTITLIEANSVYNYININDKNRYFLKYNNPSETYFNKIQNGEINFEIETKNKNSQFFCGKNGCFFTSSKNINLHDSGFLLITQNNKIIKYPYTLNISKNKLNNSEKKYLNNNGFDISKKMKFKTIQKRALSCEISATSDILSYLLGKNFNEDLLLQKLPKSKYNSFPYRKNGKLFWGNPEEGFVGHIDKLPNGEKARQRKMTGYGVLEKPIEKIIKSYGLKTKTINLSNYTPYFAEKEHLKLILEELEKGNMIQMWGDICTNPKYFNGKENGCTYDGKPSWNSERKISWFYKDKTGKEKKYTGLNGEHAFYLLGYKGNIKNPTHIIVWDTYTGRHEYLKKEWIRKWKKMQYRSIIIYKK